MSKYFLKPLGLIILNSKNVSKIESKITSFLKLNPAFYQPRSQSECVLNAVLKITLLHFFLHFYTCAPISHNISTHSCQSVSPMFYVLDGLPGIKPSQAAIGCWSSQPDAIEAGLWEQLQSLYTSHAESSLQPGIHSYVICTYFERIVTFSPLLCIFYLYVIFYSPLESGRFFSHSPMLFLHTLSFLQLMFKNTTGRFFLEL